MSQKTEPFWFETKGTPVPSKVFAFLRFLPTRRAPRSQAALLGPEELGHVRHGSTCLPCGRRGLYEEDPGTVGEEDSGKRWSMDKSYSHNGISRKRRVNSVAEVDPAEISFTVCGLHADDRSRGLAFRLLSLQPFHGNDDRQKTSLSSVSPLRAGFCLLVSLNE